MIAVFILMLTVSVTTSQNIYLSSMEKFGMFTANINILVESSRKEPKRPVVLGSVSSTPS